MDSTSAKNNSKFALRQSRIFSKELKQHLVEQIEKKKLSIREVVSLYKVSNNSVYQWIKKYSKQTPRGVKMVIEKDSSEVKVSKLIDMISDLEQNVGRKQLKIEFLEKVIELSSLELGYDLKKKHTIQQ
jgi:transposase-like protein